MAGALGSVATSTYDGTASEFVYHHKDHLGGTHIETDDTGAVLEYILYKPFGDTLLDTKSSTYENDLKYTGKEKDVDTGYYYYGARYYKADIGRFLSQDSLFLALGQPKMHSYLVDPQSLNSYAYARNNPLRMIDPTGNSFWDIVNGANKVFNFFDRNVTGGVLGASLDVAWAAGEHMDKHDASTRSIAEAAGGVTLGVAASTVSGLAGAYVSAEMSTIRIARGAADVAAGSAKAIAESSATKAVTRAITYGGHVLQRMEERGISPSMVTHAITKGTQYFDPKNAAINYVLRSGFASGHDLLVGRDMVNGAIKTVIKGADLVSSRLIQISK